MSVEELEAWEGDERVGGHGAHSSAPHAVCIKPRTEPELLTRPVLDGVRVNCKFSALAQHPEIALWPGFWTRSIALQRAGLDVLIDTISLNHPLWIQMTEAIVKEDGLARHGLQRISLSLIREIVHLSKKLSGYSKSVNVG